MKKKLACLLTALTVLSCAVPVFAAPSSTATQPKVEATTSVEGVSVAVQQEVAETVRTEAAAEAQKAAAAVSADTKATVLAVVEINLTEGSIPEGGLELTIKAEGVKAGENIVLLHQKADGTWETITPSSVKDGEIVAKFTSLSPVAIVKLEAPKTEEAPKAPKAGASLVLPMAALVCAAGAVACGRKAKAE